MTDARPRVYLDTNVFVAAFEHVGAHSDHAWWIIRAVEGGEIEAGTSEITLAEVLVKPFEVGAMDLAKGYQSMMASGSNFEVLPVRRDILVKAAALRAPQFDPASGRGSPRNGTSAVLRVLHQ